MSDVIPFEKAKEYLRRHARHVKGLTCEEVNVHLAGMSLHVTPDSFWFRVGRIGVSIMGAKEQRVSVQDIVDIRLLGIRGAISWLDRLDL